MKRFVVFALALFSLSLPRPAVSQQVSWSACKAVCSKSNLPMADDGERALLKQCVAMATCTTYADPPKGLWEGPFHGEVGKIRDPSKAITKDIKCIFGC
jgi:hypothetical protein